MSALTESVWKVVPDPALFRKMEGGVGHDQDSVAKTTTLRHITAEGRECVVPLHEADPQTIDGGQIVRPIPKYKGRKNYSGWSWTATAERTVPYESLLERARILIADFDKSVVGITSQGIELIGSNGSNKIRRFPDLFLVRSDASPLVVDVTSRSRLHDPDRIASFTWTAAAVRGTDWDYEVWCEADQVAMANLTLLSGYRRPSVINQDVVADLLATELSGELCDIENALAERHHRMDVIPAVRYALWYGIYDFEIGGLLDYNTPLTFVGDRS